MGFWKTLSFALTCNNRHLQLDLIRLDSIKKHFNNQHDCLPDNINQHFTVLRKCTTKLWDEVKFIDRDPHWYTRRVKEAIHIRLHPNNINRDSGIEISEAWMPTIKKHNKRATKKRAAEGATYRNSEDRNAPITAVENQPITAEHHAL